MPASPPTLENRSTPIDYRRPNSGRLIPLLVVSIGLHLLVALGLSYVLTQHLKESDRPVDLGIDVTLGEAVQELIVAQANPEPPAPAPPPPAPPEPPPPEPPPPVPTEKAEFIEPKIEPKVQPKPAPKKEQPKATPVKAGGSPPGAKVGPKPQEGVVGGNVTQGAVSGTPGGSKVSKFGVKRPTPPYPQAAAVRHISPPVGGRARVSYDAAGNVKSCELIGIFPPFDASARSFIRENWKGIPGSSETFPIIYKP